MHAVGKRTRPSITPGYGISTSDEGLMSWEWVEGQLTSSRNYWICSSRPDGRPHAAPVWGIWLDGMVCFSGDRKARRSQNLAANPNVTVHLESGDDVVILEGQVRQIEDMAVLTRYAEAYGKKYPFQPDPDPGPGSIVYGLKPGVVLAWLEKDYPNTATRWQFDE